MLVVQFLTIFLFLEAPWSITAEADNNDRFMIDDIAGRPNDVYEIQHHDHGHGRSMSQMNDTIAKEVRSTKSDSKIIPPPADRQKNVWKLMETFDSYKTSNSYSTDTTRPTLKSMHYLILPIWWKNESPSDPSLAMDPAQISSIMDENYQYYQDMSWGKVKVTYEILDQYKINVSDEFPGFDDTEAETRGRVDSLGYKDGVDYDGIIMIHSVPQNPPLGAGGRANMNGVFMWMSYPLDYYVTRHEMGHNFGHEHHLSNSYEYRLNRPDLKELVMPYDGYDMMSGGNNLYHGRHLAAASKWFFNWIPDSSIAMMQPEGSTKQCPTCTKSGTYVLHKFDDPSFAPSSDSIMAIHIPITVRNDGYADNLYSFWFSYRSDSDTKHGLSIHLGWFRLFGHFGAAYDSLNYDAYGNTVTREDSFVTVGSCYAVKPSAYLKDLDYTAAIAVQPMVCVDSINEGSDVTVSVQFLDPKDASSPSNPTPMQVECSTSGEEVSLSFDTSAASFIQVKSAGQDGVITLSICPSPLEGLDKVMSSYVYDEYPTSPIMYDSEPAYGSFKSLARTSIDCCEPGSTIAVDAATVVKVTNVVSGKEFLHLNEIEIFNADGDNIALNAQCFSSSSDWGGNPSCLNDGNIGNMHDTCNSHSGNIAKSFDFCVLDKPTDIRKIKIYPLWDPDRLWMLDRLRNLKVEVYATASGLEDIGDPGNVGKDLVVFNGLMETFSLVDVFNRDNFSPHKLIVTLEETTVPCPVIDGSIPAPLVYETDYGEAWVYTPSIQAGSTVSISCSVSNCRSNEYMNPDGICTQCPSQMISSAGSTSIEACEECPDGSSRSTDSPYCVLSEDYQSISSSKGWRVWAPYFHTISGWSWDVEQLKFFSDENCEELIDHNGMPIDSGNAGSGWGPSNAFDNNDSVWGGRFDDDDTIWVGMMFSSEVQVACVRVMNSSGDWGKSVSELRVQAYKDTKDKWKNVMVAKKIDTSAGGVNTISLSTCKDAAKSKFKFRYNGKKMHCKKLKKKKPFAIKKICNSVEGVKENCRITCDSC